MELTIGQVITGNKRDLGNQFPTAMENIIGYISIGPIETKSFLPKSISMLTIKDIDLIQIVQRNVKAITHPI